MENLKGSLEETILHKIQRDNKLQARSHQDASRSESEENMDGDIVAEQLANKMVTFKDKEDLSAEETTKKIVPDKDIISRRGTLRFKLKKD